MQNIGEEYVVLFRAISEAEKSIKDILAKLELAQVVAEEIYISKE